MNDNNKLSQESQIEMAQSLIDEISLDIDNLEELTPTFLLDMLGCAGLSLTLSPEASEAFVNSSIQDTKQSTFDIDL